MATRGRRTGDPLLPMLWHHPFCTAQSCSGHQAQGLLKLYQKTPGADSVSHIPTGHHTPSPPSSTLAEPSKPHSPSPPLGSEGFPRGACLQPEAAQWLWGRLRPLGFICPHKKGWDCLDPTSSQGTALVPLWANLDSVKALSVACTP